VETALESLASGDVTELHWYSCRADCSSELRTGVETALESLASGDITELHSASSECNLRTATEKCAINTR